MADRLFECVVPRGFSRYFILETLKEEAHTGKEIIEIAERKSKGVWKPSPGLIYPNACKACRREINHGRGRRHSTRWKRFCRPKALIMATGGAGRIYSFTTYAHSSTPDGLDMAYRAGMALKDMEFIQFHPTGVIPSGILIMKVQEVREDIF